MGMRHHCRICGERLKGSKGEMFEHLYAHYRLKHSIFRRVIVAITVTCSLLLLVVAALVIEVT
jgi:hypothetical protein